MDQRLMQIRKQIVEKCGSRIIKIVLKPLKFTLKSTSNGKPPSLTNFEINKLKNCLGTQSSTTERSFLALRIAYADQDSAVLTGKHNDQTKIKEASSRRSRRHKTPPANYTDYICDEDNNHNDGDYIPPITSSNSCKTGILVGQRKRGRPSKLPTSPRPTPKPKPGAVHKNAISKSSKYSSDPDPKAKPKNPKTIHPEKHRPRLFPCELCHHKFLTIGRLETHIMAFHVIDKPYECEICYKTFVSEEKLTIHAQRTHKKLDASVYQCTLRNCYALFKSKNELKTHFDGVHSNIMVNNKDEGSSFFCPICRTNFENDLKFQEHLHIQKQSKNSDSSNNLDLLKCSVCSETIEIQTQCFLGQHMRNVHGHGVHIALDIKGQLYGDPKPTEQDTNPSKSKATQHKETLTEFKCLVCAQVFPRRSDLNNHENQEKHRRWKCPLCPTLLKDKKYASDHLQSRHSDARPVKCPHSDCPKAFKTRRELLNHKYCHSTNPEILAKVKCEDCSKIFPSPSECFQHRANHHGGERPVKCPSCPKTWATTRDMKQHLLAHTEERPWPCKYCSKAFKKSAEANRHMNHKCLSRPGAIMKGANIHLNPMKIKIALALKESRKQVGKTRKSNQENGNSMNGSISGSECVNEIPKTVAMAAESDLKHHVKSEVVEADLKIKTETVYDIAGKSYTKTENGIDLKEVKTEF